MTTVGYGDTYPITVTGKLIAGFTMIGGVLCVALPTTVLGVQFGDSYAAIQEERERKKIEMEMPSEHEQHEEMLKRIAEFSELRQKLRAAREQVDKAATAMVVGNTQKFQMELEWFSSGVEQASANIEMLLNQIEYAASRNSSRHATPRVEAEGLVRVSPRSSPLPRRQ